ncbi:MAG: tape measure protein [Propionibacteriaceae bacterium]|nr:tape measure protein [Propionibacteriaceae bacterium]
MPSVRGLRAALESQLSAPVNSASKAAGETIAKNMVSGVENASRDVARARKAEVDAAKAVADAEKKVADSRTVAEEKARAVEVAEKNLQLARSKRDQAVESAEKALSDLRSSGTATTDQLAEAERKLDDARTRGDAQVLTKENSLSSARRASQKATESVTKAVEQHKAAQDKAADAADNVIAATRRYDKAQDGTNKTVGEATGLLEKLRGEASQTGDAMGKAAEKAGGFGDHLMTGLKKVGTGALLGVGAKIGATVTSGIGQAIQGGFGRLQAIDQARASLTGLGHDAGSVQQIMDNALASVKGTAFGFGDAAGLAGTLVASGIEPGQELERVLKLVGDSAAITNSDLNEMGSIWAKVAAGGRMSASEMNQLLDRNLGILPQLAEHFGVTGEEARKMVSEGKVDFETFATVMDGVVGGAALEMGDTFSGSLSNMQAALGRLGAKLLEPIFDNAPAVFNALGGAFDDIGAKLEPVIAELSERLGPIMADLASNLGPVLSGALTGLVDVLIGAGQAAGALAGWFSDNQTWIVPLATSVGVLTAAYGALIVQQRIMAAGGLVSWLIQITRAKTAWAAVTKAQAAAQAALNLVMNANPIFLVLTAITALVAGLVVFFTKTETGREIWQRFTVAMRAGWEIVKAVFAAGVEWVKGRLDAFMAGVRAVGAAWDAFRDKVGAVVGAVRTRVGEMVRVVGEIPGRIRGFFADAGRWLLDAGKNIIGGLIDGIRSMAGSVGSAIADILPDWAQGGISLFAGGGIVSAYARGGIAQLERYANGDVANGHMPEIVRGYRLFGEPETKGEAYIPFADDYRRPRAEAILSTVAERFGKRLVNADGSPFTPGYSGNLGGGQAFAEGGIRTERETLDWVHGKTVAGSRPPMGRPLERSRYTWGGGSATDWGDCSGMISLVAGFIKGMWGAGRGLRRLFATMNQGQVLRQMGFTLGKRTGPGIFSTGWFNGGPYGGHTAGQIGGTRIEMGGARGDGQINGRAAGTGHPSFTNHAWIKLKDAAPQTFASAVSGSSIDGIPTGGMAGISGGTGGSPAVSFGKAQSLWDAASKYLGVTERLSVSIPTAGTDARDPLTPSPAGVPQGDKAPSPGWGHAHFVHQAVKAAKDRRLPERAAQILAATMFVEAGNPVKKWANRSVPESLAFRHDAVGSDHDSVGDQQQRAPWGPVATRMDSYKSAGLFLDRLVKFNWQAMDPGAAAQKVQVSAHPDRYGKQMAAAAKAVKTTGLYDGGGILPPNGLAVNFSGRPEAILSHENLGDFGTLVRHLGALVPVLADIARTGDFKGSDTTFGIQEDSPIIDAALRVHEAWTATLDTIDAAQTQLKVAAFDLGGDWLGQTEIVRDAEKGLAGIRAEIAGDLDTITRAEEALEAARKDGDAAKITEAEEALTNARKNSEQAAARLEAAERTVAAARVTALGEIGKGLAESLKAGMDTVAKFGTEMARLQGMVDATRQEVSKLHMQQVTSALAGTRAAMDLRVAELDLESARSAGAVAVARAEAELASAREGHLTIGATNVNALAGAVDRFRVAGVAAIDEIALSYVVNSSEVREAEAAVAMARAQARLDERMAAHKQLEAQFAVTAATMQQVQAAQLLRAQTAYLAEQTGALHGMSQQSAGGLGRFAQGASGMLGGLGGLLSGVATGVAGFMAGGPLGAIPGALMALQSLPGIFTGGAAMKANAGEAKKAWGELDGGAKLAVGLGALGSGAAIAAGAAGSFMGMGPEALLGGVQVGQGLLDATFGSLMGTADAQMTALSERHRFQMEDLTRGFEMDQQLAAAQKSAAEARHLIEVESIKAEVEAAKLRRELAKAEREGESESVLAALRGAVGTAEARHEALVADAASRRSEIDAAVAELAGESSRARGAQVRSVTVNLPAGEPTRETWKKGYEELARQLGVHEVRINDMEADGKPSARDYVESRR